MNLYVMCIWLDAKHEIKPKWNIWKSHWSESVSEIENLKPRELPDSEFKAEAQQHNIV